MKAIERTKTDEELEIKQKELSSIVSYAAIDLETAGIDARNNQIVQMAIVLLNKDYLIEEKISFKLKLDEKYTDWNEFAQKIHGISKEEIKKADGVNVFDSEPHSPKSKIIDEASFILNTR